MRGQALAPGERGRRGEERALRYLQQRGLCLVRRNFRCRLGELDLIMQDGDTLVFVEVRGRSAERYGTPAETVTGAKRQRLARAAEIFLLGQRPLPPCRFDVVAISGCRLQWIKDAFSL